MIIEQYGIRLKRLTAADIELVRQWRNHPEIRKYMAYKKYITPKMQQAWFASIDNKLNYYFLIEYKGKNIGVINAKNVDTIHMHGEGGIFIWENAEDEYAGVLASLCLLNAVFYVLELFNKSFVRILRSNPKAIGFNSALGYGLLPGQEKHKNPYYLLTREDYEAKTKRLRETVAKLTGDYALLPKVSGEVSEKNLEEVNGFLRDQASSK